MFKFQEFIWRDIDMLSATITTEHGKALKDAYADVSRGLDVSCGCHMWQYFYPKAIRERSRLVHIFMQGHQLKENVFSPILEQNIMQLSCLMQVWMLL